MMGSVTVPTTHLHRNGRLPISGAGMNLRWVLVSDANDLVSGNLLRKQYRVGETKRYQNLRICTSGCISLMASIVQGRSVSELHGALAFYSTTFSHLQTSHITIVSFPGLPHLQYLPMELEVGNAWGRGQGIKCMPVFIEQCSQVCAHLGFNLLVA